MAGLAGGAVLGAIWPEFIRFRPLSIGLAATCIYGLAWFTASIMLLRRIGWWGALLILAAPLLLIWPLQYAVMMSCMSTNSCP